MITDTFQWPLLSGTPSQRFARYGSITHQVIQSKEAHVVEDWGAQKTEVDLEVSTQEYKSSIAVPIRLRHDKETIGVMFCNYKNLFKPTKDDIILLNMMANLAAIAFSMASLSDDAKNVRTVRAIEFSPEHFQAGVLILNYFGTVLREKYEHLEAKVRIQQDGLKVTLIVESETGEREEIEKALTEYGLVISGEMSPEKFYKDNPLKVIELKQQLQMAQVQIDTQKQMLFLAESRIDEFKSDIQWLRSQVSIALMRSGATHIEHVTGDIVTSDKVSVGDIADSSGVAIGKDIRSNTNSAKI